MSVDDLRLSLPVSEVRLITKRSAHLKSQKLVCNELEMAPPYQVNVTHELLSKYADRSLKVKEAWVAWEPILTLRNTIGVNQVVKHAFLVFVLEPGQKLLDDGNWTEYKYLRVERQQLVDRDQEAGGSAAGPAEAFLNLRLCRDPAHVLGLDIPDVNVLALKERDLVPQHGIEQPASQRVAFTLPVTLGDVLDAIIQVHSREPLYNVIDANCIWLVEQVLSQLRSIVSCLAHKAAEDQWSSEDEDHALKLAHLFDCHKDFCKMGKNAEAHARSAVLRDIAIRLDIHDTKDVSSMHEEVKSHPSYALAKVMNIGNRIVSGWFKQAASFSKENALRSVYASKASALRVRDGVAVATESSFTGPESQ